MWSFSSWLLIHVKTPGKCQKAAQRKPQKGRRPLFKRQARLISPSPQTYGDGGLEIQRGRRWDFLKQKRWPFEAKTLKLNVFGRFSRFLLVRLPCETRLFSHSAKSKDEKDCDQRFLCLWSSSTWAKAPKGVAYEEKNITNNHHWFLFFHTPSHLSLKTFTHHLSQKKVYDYEELLIYLHWFLQHVWVLRGYRTNGDTLLHFVGGPSFHSELPGNLYPSQRNS